MSEKASISAFQHDFYSKYLTFLGLKPENVWNSFLFSA